MESKTKVNTYKSPFAAMLWSIAFPSMGQIYNSGQRRIERLQEDMETRLQQGDKNNVIYPTAFYSINLANLYC